MSHMALSVRPLVVDVVSMKHHSNKQVDKFDQAITLEEWHRSNDRVDGGRAMHVVRSHDNASSYLD
jgi:hypothetical protein